MHCIDVDVSLCIMYQSLWCWSNGEVTATVRRITSHMTRNDTCSMAARQTSRDVSGWHRTDMKYLRNCAMTLPLSFFSTTAMKELLPTVQLSSSARQLQTSSNTSLQCFNRRSPGRHSPRDYPLEKNSLGSNPMVRLAPGPASLSDKFRSTD